MCGCQRLITAALLVAVEQHGASSALPTSRFPRHRNLSQVSLPRVRLRNYLTLRFVAKLRVAARASPRRGDGPTACPQIQSFRTGLGSRPPLTVVEIRPCVAAPSPPHTCTHIHTIPEFLSVRAGSWSGYYNIISPPPLGQRRLQQCHSSSVTCRSRRLLPGVAPDGAAPGTHGYGVTSANHEEVG